MDIKKFVDRRKALRLSQVKLSDGICTQATLSKFERNGHVPSLTILDQLCSRLGLTVDELNQVATTSVTHIREQLDAIERELMMENYQQVLAALNKIEATEIDAIPLQMQFYYLRGILRSLINREPDEVLFDFSRILNELDENHETIFTQLAYVGSGVMYSRRNQLDRAEFYFKKTRKFVRATLAANASPQKGNTYLRLLTILFYTAQYDAAKKDYSSSNQLITDGIALCSEKHVTYYLPRLKLLAAQNAIESGAQAERVTQLMNEALAFARINQNEVVELQVAALRKRFAAMMKQQND
ncbi:helix-turn-helix domain-containing protein [Secundilactobacillus kimchicus]|uniref:XRE family transcriptional regulator n=1 Tax=Secundilactobacillus kimchicus JCM 15530 TaxID=1302272 RepID=A0A0R1HX79_9LACO|nr:helix-turn-helix transcriptional regulator [Secundilactobacillus kimchicus]KRK49171.1 XRE family transcriptional regulator [Secundilactobacillus kimchicus JCM 15530]MBT9672716.1 helix-turn-helix domain-containing protein [Secundilactobacillus kimchicus]